ncbi:tyrosine-type recombinase/integrase [Allomesorhizobium camelthorni]|uniref:Site-specific integrase n=1 Tax=Allomesorhizobium camelthorni TaxID=475069 RepID=A0A6G4WHM1_9HYPH|nr:site-specific integrase [Mesorhizobium camelthorni]NGO54104.1 site-specific integrase [Mesorhizobium camelthorni]
MSEKHTILGDKVNLYKRPGSPLWQCSTYLKGKNWRVSTKEESLAKAKDWAEDWYLGLRGKVVKGELKTEKTFKQVAEKFVGEYAVITAGERNEKYTEDHQSRLRNHLVPFFGELGLSEITSGAVQEYRVHRIKAGSDSSDRTFEEAAKGFLRAVAAVKGKQRTTKSVESHKIFIKTHLLPFFGSLSLSAITESALEEYRTHRAECVEKQNRRHQRAVLKELETLRQVQMWVERMSKPPSKSTMHHEIVTLRQVLKTAVRHGWLTGLPDMSTPYRSSGKITHRAWFSPEEYKRLYQATRENARKAKGLPWQAEAEQLHDMVLFMANTGIRPDEANWLEYRDVHVVEDEATKETILEIEVRGKRGVGYCKSTTGAVRPFQRMKERNKPKSTDRLFPSNHKRAFNRILEEQGLKVDRQGNSRTLYSLRHSYISFRLLEGADIYQIAKNCRTSVEMIEKHYAVHLKNSLDAAAINVRRIKSVPKAS